MGGIGRANVMTPIHENKFESDIFLQASVWTFTVHAKDLNQNLVLSTMNLILNGR